MKNVLKILSILVMMLLVSCVGDVNAVVLERKVKSVDTTFTYRVKTTEGLHDYVTKQGKFQINDTISFGYGFE